MRHRLYRFAREIHRRSVWQVLGAYVALSWGALESVDFLTAFAGLPAWTPRFTLVLLALGLPLVTATAFVQRGFPGLPDPYDAVDPNDLVGLTPEQVHVLPGPLDRATFLTWRNAVLTGVCGAVVLIGSVTAYLVMWAFGIGPVGSLIAQGVLAEGDPIILADLVDHSGAPALAGVVDEALRADLGTSSVITLVPATVVASALSRLGQRTTGSLTPGLALQVAAEEGIKAVVVTELARRASDYELTAAFVDAVDGRTIASYSVSIRSDDLVRPAVDRLAARVREKAGESRRAIRASRRGDTRP